MSVMRGHEDLKPKAVVGFEMGYALVQCGSEVKRYRLTIGPNGALHGEPEPDREQAPVDQISADEITATTISADEIRARRWHDIDQPIA